jgi:hypothetical protein
MKKGTLAVNTKPYISQSQLTMFERCGEQYRRRYIMKEVIPPGITLIRGTSVHKGAQQNFTYKLKKKKDMKASDVIEIAVQTYEDELKKGILLTHDEKRIGQKKVKGITKDTIVRMTGIFCKNIAPKYMPKFVEEEHRISWPEKKYDLLAKMDICDVKDVIVDIKTSTRKKNQLEVDTSEQLSFYAMVFKALTGRLPKGVSFETIIANKGTLETQKLSSMRSLEDLRVILRRINAMVDAMDAQIFVPTSPTNWWCSPRYCGYYYQCRFVKGMTGK